MAIITKLDVLPEWPEGTEFPAYDGNIYVEWTGHGRVNIEIAQIEYDEDDNEVDPDSVDLFTVRMNYLALRDRWRDFIVEAITEIEDLINEYGREEFKFHPEEACFTVYLPVQPMENNCHWSFSLQEDRAWVLDYSGWLIVEREAVF